jgi:hypothetical protein
MLFVHCRLLRTGTNAHEGIMYDALSGEAGTVVGLLYVRVLVSRALACSRHALSAALLAALRLPLCCPLDAQGIVDIKMQGGCAYLLAGRANTVYQLGLPPTLHAPSAGFLANRTGDATYGVRGVSSL